VLAELRQQLNTMKNNKELLREDLEWSIELLIARKERAVNEVKKWIGNYSFKLF
jgi:hypothetical protein